MIWRHPLFTMHRHYLQGRYFFNKAEDVNETLKYSHLLEELLMECSLHRHCHHVCHPCSCHRWFCVQ